jgi:hypothetical protein
MRHVIYLLVVVNLVYFSWNMLDSMPHEGGPSLVKRIPHNVRHLETIQEREEKKSTAKDDVGDSSDDAPVVARRPGNAEAHPGTSDISQVETLTKSEPPGAVAPPLSCHVLGPFTDDLEMKSVENRLDQLGYQPRERTSDIRVESGYWVYLPAMEREEALRITRILKQHNDTDYLIVKDNAISLGAYDSPSRADIRLKMLRKYGLEPVVESRYVTRSVTWLDLEQRDKERAVLNTIRGEYPDVEVKETVCE